jgi:hypothetical protein
LIELPQDRKTVEMLAPANNWSWCSGAIVHFDLKKDLKAVVKQIAHAMGQKRLVPTWIHSSSSKHATGWEDHSLPFLNEKEEKTWELSGKFFRFRCPK